MTPDYVLEIAVLPALALLPANMDTPAARAMTLAIGMQESRFQHRRQIGGPARGMWQFEQGGGVRGVLVHPASRPHIQTVLTALNYSPSADAGACFDALEHNDILAAAFARLLLWTHPKPLPARSEVNAAWLYYMACWRPGKPHESSWSDLYHDAWEVK